MSNVQKCLPVARGDKSLMVIGPYELLPGNGQMKNALPLAQALGVFTFEEPKRIEEDESLGMPKLVVRNTFLDLEEDDTQDPADRPKRRTRSAKRFPVELSVAEFA